MKKELKKFQVRTDIAVEEAVLDRNIFIEKRTKKNCEITKVIIDEKHGKQYGKKPGIYFTVETKAFVFEDHDEVMKAITVLKDVIHEVLDYLKIDEKMEALIVGLGNEQVTPDALGPLVVQKVTVTKHLFRLHPEEVQENFRSVCAFVPKVMGQTGMESSDMIKAIILEEKPDFVIIVDALASKSIDRVNTTIQITDAGINPGSGVGNMRKEISKKTLGIPVIALGVPTVVDAISITNDTIDYLLNNLYQEVKKEEELNALNVIKNISQEKKRAIIRDILTPSGINLMVTPKDIDANIRDLSQAIARAIDISLHKLND